METSRRVEVEEEGADGGGAEDEDEGAVESEGARGGDGIEGREGTEGDEGGEARKGEESEEERETDDKIGGRNDGGLPCEVGAVLPPERSPAGNCRASAIADMRAPSCGVG
jgi:hypothetical protein